MKILSIYNLKSHSIPAKRQESVKKNTKDIANLKTEIQANSENIDTNYVRILDNKDGISMNDEEITNNTAVMI